MSIPLRVLIVEDSEDDALLVVRRLRQGGYEPEHLRVDSPRAMSAALEEREWDIIITDHNMPEFSSDLALEAVNECDLDTPVIIVSGSIGEEYAVSAMKAGAHDYVMKDNLARLIPAIDRELREARIRRAHREAEAVIRHMAFHDGLTGLVNRREFEHRLELALASAQERDLHHALLYMDLDQFKVINDTCGHAAGDALLTQLSLLCQEHVRGNDTLARLGGDEFGVLLESCPLDRAKGIADDLRREISAFRFAWEGRLFNVGISIGLVPVTAECQGVGQLLGIADMACYAAKDQGRNRVHVYSDQDADFSKRHGDMQWVSRIREALDEDRFLLYRQPIVPVRDGDGAVAGYEYLIRMRERTGDVVAPGAFLPAAEHYDLMPTLDRWVIGTVFERLSRDGADGATSDAGLTSYINLSGRSLNDDRFFAFIHRQLEEYRLRPEAICFEITETAAIANPGKAAGFFRELREAGCKLALDDFGSGFSSFAYLRMIPVDFVKIDGSFVTSLLDDPMSRAIVEAIADISRVAGARSIAEFVESGAIREKLGEIGVDFAQGYGIQKPVPLDG